jgi:3-deoxy-D-manno-octulosonic acid kinase
MRLPEGYTLLRAGRVCAAIRRDLVSVIGDWLLAVRLDPPADAVPLAAGRGSAYRLRMAGAPAMVVRPYRRGGLLAHLVRETYLGPSPRPLRELATTVEVRRRGVRAPEVLAARVEGTLLYRGALVTAELESATTLIDALRGAPDAAARTALAADAGRAVGRLHAAGIFHADLNLTNIVVQRDPDGAAVGFVDFDRARLSATPLATAARRRNLARLSRSLAKLDADGTLAGAAERQAFCAAYADEPAVDARRAVEAACAS